jgi:hypothetical protein
MTQKAIQRVLWTLSVVLALALGALGARYLLRAPDGPPPIASIVAMSHLDRLESEICRYASRIVCQG